MGYKQARMSKASEKHKRTQFSFEGNDPGLPKICPSTWLIQRNSLKRKDKEVILVEGGNKNKQADEWHFGRGRDLEDFTLVHIRDQAEHVQVLCKAFSTCRSTCPSFMTCNTPCYSSPDPRPFPPRFSSAVMSCSFWASPDQRQRWCVVVYLLLNVERTLPSCVGLKFRMCF